MFKASKRLILATVLLVLILMSPVLFTPKHGGNASGWTDGSELSVAHPHYGIHDIISEMSILLFRDLEPDNSSFVWYWYLPNASDSNPSSFNSKRMIPGPEDNFLAYTDDVLEGWDGEDYFINHGKPWPQTTSAPEQSQKYANRTRENLTAWLLEGSPPGSIHQHKAAYNLGVMSHFVGDMAQFGHTDYSILDRGTKPTYDPDDDFYYKYYEAHVWKDAAMTALIEDFENMKFKIPEETDHDDIYNMTADLARWVNSRDRGTVTMQDVDMSTITVGYNYKRMLLMFTELWDARAIYRSTEGFNSTLWNLTLENLRAAAENLTAMYRSIWNSAWEEFLSMSADLTVVEWNMTPAEPIAGDLVTINATVYNQGSISANEFLVTVSLSGSGSDTKPLTVPAGESRVATFKPLEVGTEDINVTIWADSTEMIVESSEENNHLRGNIFPIPEHHSSSLELLRDRSDQRRDTEKNVTLIIHNGGNRFDLFTVSGETDHPGVGIEPPANPIPVLPGEDGWAELTIMISSEAQLGNAAIEIEAVGYNSSANLSFDLEVLERTGDPVPSISGTDWARLEEVLTLSASGTYDPDGNPLNFTWWVPEWGVLYGEEISVNFTELGEKTILLIVHDGNATARLEWTVRVYPEVPENLSVSIQGRGLTGISLSWETWGSGGLNGYWLEASALPGQGNLSSRGPFVTFYGPGNGSGRVGRFLPGTEVIVRMYVDAGRFGNVSMAEFVTRTQNATRFQEDLKLQIVARVFKVQFRPWGEPEGEVKPSIEVSRYYAGEFIPLGTTMHNVTLTDNVGIVHYDVGSNTGRYRAVLRYSWRDEDGIPFMVEGEVEEPNTPPNITFNSPERRWSLNENGTARVHFELKVQDPEDTVDITLDWGDGNTDSLQLQHTSGYRIFHNYSSADSFTITVTGSDWSGEIGEYQYEVEIREYSPPDKGEDTVSLIIRIILIVLLFIALVVVISILVSNAVRSMRKKMVVDFDREKMEKGKERVGTGTDFDRRKDFLIPKDSIMVKVEEPEVANGSPEGDDSAGEPTIIKGQVRFDDEE